jgi:cytoskeletal protein RodZ
MKTKTFLLALGAASGLPLLSFAQTTNTTTSPTSSADGGAQHTTMPSDASAAGPTSGPATDAPHLSSTNTQTGGATDTGTPKDNADKNPNVDHQNATDTSTTTTVTNQ